MTNWADKWMDEGLGQPLIYLHQNCGHTFKPTMTCSECGEEIHARQVKPQLTQAYFTYLEQQKKA